MKKRRFLRRETVNHFPANFILFWIGFHAKVKTAQRYIEANFNALDSVIDVRTYTIADPWAIQPRSMSVLS